MSLKLLNIFFAFLITALVKCLSPGMVPLDTYTGEFPTTLNLGNINQGSKISIKPFIPDDPSTGYALQLNLYQGTYALKKKFVEILNVTNPGI